MYCGFSGEKMSEVEREKKQNKVFDKSFVIIVSILVFILIAEIVLYSFVLFHVTIKGSSMEPTLYDDQSLMVNKLREPTRNDIVIISGKATGGKLLVKRVVAIGGDTVTIKDGYVYVNGEKQFEDYLNVHGITFYPTVFDPTNTKEKTWQVKNGEYFFLGDNRMNSNDSRYYGTCKRDQIEGVVTEFALKLRGVTKVLNTVAVTVKGWFGIRGAQGE